MDTSDSPKSGNPASGGATGDLWKKVLDEVQSEAAARRSKVGARSASAPRASNIEVDLLKRILLAVETKPAGAAPADHSELLNQILDSIKHPPQLDPSQITSPILAALERADHDSKFKALEASVAAQLQAQLKALRESQPVVVDQAEKLKAVAQAINESTQGAIRETQGVIREALSQQPTVDVQMIVAPILEALAQQNVQPTLDRFRDEVKQQIKAAAQAEIAAQANLTKVAEAVQVQKPVDVTPQLEEIRQELRQAIAAIPRTPAVDFSAKLDEILAAAKEKPDDGRDEVLLQILDSVQKLAATPTVQQPAVPTALAAEDAAKLQAILAAIAAQKPVDVDALALRMEQAIQQNQSAAASPDTAAKFDALQEQLSAHLAQLRSGQQEERQALTSQLEAQIKALLASHEAALTAHAASNASPPPVDPLPAIEVALSAQREQTQSELQQLRESLTLELTRQNDKVREDLLAHSIELIDQIKASTPASAQEQLQQLLQSSLENLRSEISKDMTSAIAATVPPQDKSNTESEEKRQEQRDARIAQHQVELETKLAAKLDAIEAKIASQPAVPVIDEDALVARIRAAMPVPTAPPAPAPPLDTAALVEQIRAAMPVPIAPPAPAPPLDTAALVEQIRAAMPAPVQPVMPAPIEFPTIPSHAQDFAKQQEMLRDLANLIRSQAVASRDEDGDDLREQQAQAIRQEVQSLIKQQKLSQQQSQQQFDRTMASLGEDVSSALEAKLNKGLAKLELALATSDQGRPPSIGSDNDGNAGEPVSNYRYSWMNQSAPRNRTPAIALTVTAVAAVGMFLVLLINALTGNNNQPPAQLNNTGGNNTALASGNPDSSKTNTPLSTNPKTPTTPTTPPGTTPTKDEAAPLPTGPLFPKATGTGEPPRIAGPLVSELRHLTDPNSPRTRVVYELAQARKIVFLIHISGKTPAAMTTIVSELKKTMAQMNPTQRFTLVFSEGNRFVEVPPAGLREGSDGERNRVENWMDLNIRAASHKPASSPLVAIDVAMSYEPDLLWVVSDAIVTDEPGHVSSKEILDRIAALNPQGSIRIAATQIGSPDAGSTLRTLAEKYGGAFISIGDPTSASIAP